MNIYKRYFRKYRVLFFTATTFVFLEAMADLLQPTIMARIIDEGVREKNVETVIGYGLLMLFITFLGAVFATLRNILASKVSQGFGKDLRADLFEKIMNFSEGSADRMESGSLITRMTNDTAQAVQFVNGMMRIFFKAPVTGIGSMILAAALSPKLSMILFLVVGVVAVLIYFSMKLSYERFAKVQYAMDRLNLVVQEYLLGIRLVKAFGRQDFEEEKFAKSNEDLERKGISSQLVIAYFAPVLSLVVSLGIAMVLYAGSILFVRQEIEVGKVAAFISYMTQILTSIIMITNIFTTFVRTKASTERIHEVFMAEEDAKGGTKVSTSEAMSVVFENLSFSYPSGSGLYALENLSFRINAGETLAVIGPTGSGKSTLVWLLLRFYDVKEGRILLDGIDIRDYAVDKVRNAVSVSSQKTMLFSGSIRDNIAWSSPEMSPERVESAAQAAQAEEFILSMQEGYESSIYQGAVNLSGGQKQRVSIARALAKESKLLILDDSTSALDAVTDRKVREAIKEFKPRRTTILITQRIGTAMGADKILVLSQGKMEGFGTHEDLMKNSSTYRDLYVSQIGELDKAVM
ncbi:ABC transporter ATP-binding protein [Proteiniclasticum ruminis]|uniref:ATP-binding cassette, subfamily B n=1 Tax=Proteiniclasticum ruminis TaxID=398199 RepID=A0A1G8I8R8_9CLOT|nr:ABC transporter ATP-binding protein [Proteiniclasticum ruminis]SDI15242.1 ATP-binding cassette, subfamily B [Proteiniclasticum ruminis]